MPEAFVPVPGVSYANIIWPNPEGTLAVVCLWEQAPRAAERHPDAYMVGNCYSPRGVGHILRTLLANPQITELRIEGPDLSGTKEMLLSTLSGWWRDDINEHPPGWPKAGTGLEDVPVEVGGEVASTFDFGNPASSWARLSKRTSVVYPAPINETSEDTFRGIPGNRVSGTTVSDVWPLVLAEVMDHGAVSGTSYGNRQKEVAALTWVVTDVDAALEGPLPPWMGFTTGDGRTYARDHLLYKVAPEGVAYTYGAQMRAPVDQFEAALALLQASPEQRRVYITPWDRTDSLNAKSPPCLVGFWLRKDTDGTLMMHATFRSRDMHRAFGKNVFGLCSVLHWFAERLTMRPGILVGSSLSAHVYEDCWEEAEVVARRGRGRIEWDARSAFNISIDADAPGGGSIIAERLSPDGAQVLMRYTGATAAQVEKKLRRDRVVTTPGHGLYLGIQLAEAEAALRS